MASEQTIAPREGASGTAAPGQSAPGQSAPGTDGARDEGGTVGAPPADAVPNPASGAASDPATPAPPVFARPSAAPPRQFRDLLALDDFERHARRRLPRMVFGYVAGAVETGASYRATRDAFADYRLRPRMFRDVSGRDLSTELFGHLYAAPFGVAPIGGAAFVAYRADVRMAEAAAAANLPMILSASSLIPMEDVYAANPNIWYQGYLAGDQPRIDRLLDRVERTGIRTLVVTGDTPLLGNREHNIRSGFSMPMKVTPKVMWQSALAPGWLLGTVARTMWRHGAPHFENTDAERGPPMMSSLVRNTQKRDELSWRHVAAIRKRWSGNLVVKGIMTAEDARIARDCGADGVILSNHGGRQLDHTIAPLHSIPELVAEKGDMKLMIDSGFRRGTDVLKALALGADFVFVGRPFIFGAVIGGAAGVRHAFELLRAEVDRDLALIGLRRPAEIDVSYLAPAPGRTPPMPQSRPQS